MASVRSLGVHKPSALPFLVAEGILPPESPRSSYRWETFTHKDGVDDNVEEEVVTTDYCVVWSRGGTIERVFRFEAEKESVTQAVFTTFTHPYTAGTKERHATVKNDIKTPASEGGLKTKKKRPRSQDGRAQQSRATQEQAIFSARKVSASNKASTRALVVVLKTQAHIYLISQTSHVVHLPFEVDKVFPAHQGILLQRKSTEHTEHYSTPVLPPVPQNTFSLSQSTAGAPSATTESLGGSGDDVDAEDPLAPLLGKLRTATSKSATSELPRLFCLQDSMTQLGAVVTNSRSAARQTLSPRQHLDSPLRSLDPSEDLLYISNDDEFSRHHSFHSNTSPFAIAVTENSKDSAITLWSVTYATTHTDNDILEQSSRTLGGNASRRRSSFNSRLSTGANTPIARSHRHTSRELSHEDQNLQRQPDLLDSVFENPANPARSSRRVSSLLARADLSTTQDKETFTDLLAGGRGKRKSRRGPSFGPQLNHSSLDHDSADDSAKTHPLFEITSSIDSVSLQGQSSDAHLDDVHDAFDAHDTEGSFMDKHRLRNEIVFQQISRVPFSHPQHSDSTNVSHLPQTHAFTLESPGPVFNKLSDKNLLVCVTKRRHGELLMFQVRATDRGSSQKIDDSSLPDIRRYSIKVTGTRRSGIRDACKVTHGYHDWIMVLDGKGTLSLQAPWTTMLKIELSNPLSLFNPYQITPNSSPKRATEGSMKRTIGQLPKGPVALEHSCLNGTLDVVSRAGDGHRISVQLAPSNPLVARLIRICQLVLPASETNGDSVLRGWWDVMLWLEAQKEEVVDSEWTAWLILLFSFAISFMDESGKVNVPRQKRRKGGLLRSSSGANTDLESWNGMMRQECGISSSTPSWMAGGAWQWTNSEESVARSLSALSGTFEADMSSGETPLPQKSSQILHCVSMARDFAKSGTGQEAFSEHGYSPVASSRDPRARQMALASILVALHLYREELKLDTASAHHLHLLCPMLAQIGTWLRWPAWSSQSSSYYMLENADMRNWLFDESIITGIKVPGQPFEPPSILKWLELSNPWIEASIFPTLTDAIGAFPLMQEGKEAIVRDILSEVTPRTILITSLLYGSAQTIHDQVRRMASSDLHFSVIEALPEGVAMRFRRALSTCQRNPPAGLDSGSLQLAGREDLAMIMDLLAVAPTVRKPFHVSAEVSNRDVHSTCSQAFDVENVGPYDGSAEIDRQSITRLIFHEDQRFAEAAKVLHPLQNPIAHCIPEAGWAESDLLEAQQELAKIVALRTLSVSLGRSLLFYSARAPIITEKFPIHGFTLSCTMKPSDSTVTADRAAFTEEKVSWAFFHAGAEAGLSISKEAKGVDTSWILFNKPRDLTHRHAGFLFALGLNGHLRSIAKWVAFKYLTPKHNMTSIGLLLGLSASYLGTMDTMITRLLSVHVVRMLPPGAAELNLTPLTQTCGIMGIGLLYCNTQHRRMSEILLSELENMEVEEGLNPMDILRDEGYRLAAGFALGYINLGRGGDLRGLRDMHIAERLLTLAVATKYVDQVHISDSATAGAIISLALIYIKSNDEALARKIDVPNTNHQFEYLRPDLFLLRTVTKQLIMWDTIQASQAWVTRQMPLPYGQKRISKIQALSSEDLPYLNVLAGLCLSIGLRFAGSGDHGVRDLLCGYLDHFMRLCRFPAMNFDGKLARITVRNCQDVLALSTSCVMAGTGDIVTFRRLRSLHGRTDSDTPYGSHLVAHFAIGFLFLGGGTHTLGTSNLAIASLLCAFYPLFPTSVLDNKSHLQAFRHLWVLAAERRCLVPRDIDSHRPLSVPIIVKYKDGNSTNHTAPFLLPDLSTIFSIATNDPEYWPVTLEIATNPTHLSAFQKHQSIYLRRRDAYDTSQTSAFAATMKALNDTQAAHQLHDQPFEWLFTLPAFSGFDRAERALVLPADAAGLNSGVSKGLRGTALDDRLFVETACLGDGRSERLWNLRLLLKSAEDCEKKGEELRWFNPGVIEGMRARLAVLRSEKGGRKGLMNAFSASQE